MRDAAHGTRRRYQDQACHCDLCRAANTAYSAHYREAARANRPPLGAHVAGTEAARVIAALVAEGFRKAQIARWYGYRRPERGLKLRLAGDVTIRTLLRLRTIQRRVCA